MLTQEQMWLFAPESWHPNWPLQEAHVQFLGIGSISQEKQIKRWLIFIGIKGKRENLKPHVANIALNQWGRDVLYNNGISILTFLQSYKWTISTHVSGKGLILYCKIKKKRYWPFRLYKNREQQLAYSQGYQQPYL